MDCVRIVFDTSVYLHVLSVLAIRQSFIFLQSGSEPLDTSKKKGRHCRSCFSFGFTESTERAQSLFRESLTLKTSYTTSRFNCGQAPTV